VYDCDDDGVSVSVVAPAGGSASLSAAAAAGPASGDVAPTAEVSSAVNDDDDDVCADGARDIIRNPRSDGFLSSLEFTSSSPAAAALVVVVVVVAVSVSVSDVVVVPVDVVVVDCVDGARDIIRNPRSEGLRPVVAVP
jgi:hypothetical protein